ncbi:uncharacterized protein LOC131930930 [Physella acuta]|uniref:uncharacterized protein LOC131930929 n=1 Tax=Physella acuta TaxID=109671 RepID=UPI0027DD2E0F|nr:uncharacterized protein LOC131930929 [Physella acuta]XP_059143570.1 uncharacterized protein LOC131930930 [Physella acuta]
MAEVAQTISIVPPREILIRKFHGDSHGYEVERFIDEVQSLWRARRDVSVEERKDLLWQYLGEAVREELSCRGDDLQRDPEASIRLLREVYGEKRSVSQLMAQLQMVVQGQHESVRAYSHRLHRAFKALVARQGTLQVPQTNAEFLRDQFMEKLSQSSVRRQLQELVFRDPKIPFLAIRDAAIRWSGDEDPGTEPAYVAALHARPKEEPTLPRSKLEDRVDKLAEQLSALLTQLAQNPQVSSSRRVPRRRPEAETRMCYNCNQQGHLARNCRNSKKQEAAVIQSLTTAGGQSPSSTIHKLAGQCPTLTVYLQGVPVTAVIDSGSQVSTVTETFCNRSLKNIILRTDTPLSLRAANGLAIPYNGYFITDLEINKEEIRDKGFLVIKDPVGGSSAPPCLLGMNVLQDLTTLAHLIKPPGVTPKVWRGDKVLRPRERTLVSAKSVPTIQATKGDPGMKDDKVVQPLDQQFHPDPSVVSGPTSCLRASITSIKVDQSEELEAMVPPNPSLIKAPGGGAGGCPQTESSKKDKQVKKAPVAELAIGDLVLLRQPPLGRRKMADLDDPTVYVVVEVPPITGGCYAIKKKDGPSGTRRVASTQIRRYVPPRAQPPSPRPVKVIPPATPGYSHIIYKVQLPGTRAAGNPTVPDIPLRRSVRERRVPSRLDL